ncbi:MAG: S1 family peptidase [archaeon YNP-LCB-003-016]|nr:S1 family peptidase [Candidatus Culexarchaeum yellowstonense]
MNTLEKCVSLILLTLLFCSFAFVGVGGVQAKDIKEARKHAEEILLPLEGIAGISHREDPPRIIVYLEHEKYKDKVPNEIDGFKTEVIVIGKVKALSLLQLEEESYTFSGLVCRTTSVRPIVGGISIGVPKDAFGGKMAGTLGLVVQGPGGYYYILSNAHVIAMNSKAQFLPLGTAVLQPGTYDGGTTEDKVGELYSYIKITFGPKGKNYADAAIANITITETDYLIGEVLDSDNKSTYTISGTTEVSIGDYVRKSGRTTGVTISTVSDTSATVKVWYTQSKWAVFYDQILVNQPFIESGDSGSPVDKDGKFVGLVFAGSSNTAVVCKAKYIISGLGITI